MARVKLTDEQKAIKKEEQMKIDIANQLASQLEDCRKHAQYFQNPTYFFEVGEMVNYGAHKNTQVEEVLDGGIIYKVRVWGDITEGQRKGTSYERHDYHSWIELRKKGINSEVRLGKEETFFIQYYNSHLSSLILRHYQAGIDMNPEYQRGYVWTMEDKISLIDSIFNNVDIGKFVFIQRPYGCGKEIYEVLDGKQRLSTLIEFYEDRFKWNGLLFSQLHWRDKTQFKELGVSVGDVSDCSREEKINIFLKLNTSGKVMDKAHLEKVRAMLINDKTETK